MHLPVNVPLKLCVYSHTGTVEMAKGYLLIAVRPVWTWHHRYLWLTSMKLYQ